MRMGKFAVEEAERLYRGEKLLGDVDLNNNININDATTLARYLADLSDLSEVKKLNGDFDGNEILNINDITSIQRFIAEN